MSERTESILARLRNTNLMDDYARIEAADEIDRLRQALRYGIGTVLNERSNEKLPLEWTPDSGIGRMLAALDIDATCMDDTVRAALGGQS